MKGLQYPGVGDIMTSWTPINGIGDIMDTHKLN